MVLAARNDLFSFRFPNSFIPKEVKEKYHPYINRLPNALDDATEFVNYTIQGVNIPEVRQEPAVQTFSGINKNHRSSMDLPNLFNREISVSLFLTEGYINYWILYETFLHYYKFDNAKQHIDFFDIDLLNEESEVLASLKMREILFTGLDPLNLSHAENTQAFATVNASFTFNRMDIVIHPYIGA